jgi:hypothetical protein
MAIEELSYVPHAKQVKLHEAFGHFQTRVAVTGARGGKTTCGIHDVVDRAIRQPGFYHSDIDRGEPYHIAVAAPLHSTVQEVIRQPLCRAIPERLIIRQYHSTDRNVKIQGLHGETWISFFSASKPSAWQGRKWYGFWMDEFPLCPEGALDEASARLSDRQGWTLLTGTPQGPNWAFKRLYKPWEECQKIRAQLDATASKVRKEELEQQLKYAEGNHIFFATWKTVENPHIDKEYIEGMRRRLPSKYFKRTFEASWEYFEGQVYEDFLEQVHVVEPSSYEFILPSGRRSVKPGMDSRGMSKRGLRQKVQLGRVMAGVDWGFGSGHEGAIVVGGVGRDGTWYILEDERDEGVLVVGRNSATDSWVKRAQILKAKWEIDQFVCDTQSPANIGQFRAAGLAAEGAVKDVSEGIQAVSMLLKPDEETLIPKIFFLRSCEKVIDEIQFYHWLPGRETPAKINDHCMDALRYLIYTHSKRGVFRRQVNYTAGSLF